MKTSNKLLIGALCVILCGMMYANLTIKSKLNELKDKPKTEMQQVQDSASVDSASAHIRFSIK